MWKNWIRTAVIVIGTLGWWGFVYPELTLTEETYVQSEADMQGLQVGELRIKSRLLEYILAEDETGGFTWISHRKKDKPKG